MRHDDEALDLLVAGVGERERRPIGVALAGAHVHAPDDSVGAGRGRNEDAVTVAALPLDNETLGWLGKLGIFRIEDLARRHGRPKDEFILEAILQYLADQEDVELARRRLAEPGQRKTLQELEKELGLDG